MDEKINEIMGRESEEICTWRIIEEGKCLNNPYECRYWHPVDADVDSARTQARQKKTLTPCAFFVNDGSCTKGETCEFLHVNLIPPIDSEPPPTPYISEEICVHAIIDPRRNKCQRDAYECNDWHPVDADVDSARTQARQKNTLTPCTFFVNDGSCTKGETCEFLHVRLIRPDAFMLEDPEFANTYARRGFVNNDRRLKIVKMLKLMTSGKVVNDSEE